MQPVIRVLVVLAALGLAIFALRGVDLGKTLDIILGAQVPLLILALLAQGASLTGRATRWKLALRPVKDVRLGDAASPLLISFFIGNVTFTGVGIIPRVYVLKKKTGIDEAFATGTIAQEIIIDASTLLLVSVVTPLFIAFPPALRVLQIVLVPPLIVLLLIDVAMARHSSLMVGLFVRLKVWERIVRRLPRVVAENMNSFGDGMGAVFFHPRLSIAYFLITAIIWTADAVMFWLLMLSIGLDFGFLNAAIVMGYTNALISVVVVPGFVGTLELSAIGLMIGLGAPQAATLAFTALLRVFLLVPSVIIGFVFAAREGFKIRAGSR